MTRLQKDPFNLIIAGVGGQGNILASQVVAQAALLQGLNATIGETYGVSQRGGSVMSHVRVTTGDPAGPLIAEGEADLLVGFEPLETLQVAMTFASPDTRVLCNPRPIYPVGVLAGDQSYPPVDRILEVLRRHVRELKTLSATEIARQAGEIRAMNLVMVGAIAAEGSLPMDKETYLAAMEELLPATSLEVNKRAFEAGYRATPSCQKDNAR